MTFEQYTQRYLSFQAGLMQVQLGLVVASDVFSDFPNRLPQSLRQEFLTYAQTVAGLLHISGRDAQEGSQAAIRRMAAAMHSTLPEALKSLCIPDDSLVKNSEKTWNWKLVSPFLFAILTRSFLPVERGLRINFQRTINSQHLFLAFGYADEFGSESMQAILDACPERLKTNKNLTWQKVQELGSWDAIQAFMKDTLCFDFGLKCLADRIVSLRDDFGVALSVDDTELNQLHEAELIRNLFMHAGGTANAEYEKRTRIKAYRKDDVISLEAQDVTATINLIHKLCLAVFDGISRHFFKTDPTRLPGILRPGEPPS